MLTVEGIYDGEKVQFLEDIPVEGRKKVLVIFPDRETSEKDPETKTPAQVLPWRQICKNEIFALLCF